MLVTSAQTLVSSKYAKLTPFWHQCNTGLTLDFSLPPINSRLQNPVFTQLHALGPPVSYTKGFDCHMVSQSYDIFRRDPGGHPVWLEAARDLETAKTRIIELSAAAPGQYVVFSQRSGRMVSSGTVVASPAARASHKELENSSGGCAESSVMESDTLWK